MKVLLFTHRNDIDGMGSAVLAKLVFKDVTYIGVEGIDLEDKVETFIKSKEIYNYDYVFITDIPVTFPFVERIAKDIKLKNKLFIFDHHKASFLEIKENYDFLTIKLKYDYGLASATSLFYDFLVENNFLDKDNEIAHEFSELTRKYDTWEWKTIYHDETPKKLTHLFDALENETYIDLMCEKLKKGGKFSFTNLENELIKSREKVIEEKINYYLTKLHYREIKGYKTIIAFINYEYRNDLADYLRDNKYDADFVILVALDNDTISYRTINNTVSGDTFSKFFNGKGHDKAAGSPIASLDYERIIDILFKEKIKRVTIDTNEKFLRQKSLPVDLNNKYLKSYISKLENFCLYNDVMAIAAVQIGIPERLIYLKNTNIDIINKMQQGIQTEEENNYNEARVLINPIVLKREGLTRYYEACASCLDNMGLVERPYKMQVKYFDTDGNIHEEVFKGFEATVLSHEIDHLDGILHMDVALKVLVKNYEERKKWRVKHPYRIIRKKGNYEDLRTKN